MPIIKVSKKKESKEQDNNEIKITKGSNYDKGNQKG
jgi:hypothetical protein